MATPYSPKRGQYAGRQFGSQMEYMNVRAQGLGFANYYEERSWRLDEAVRRNILNIYPNYPPDRLRHVLDHASNRQKTILRHTDRQGLDDNDLGVDTDVFYHKD